MVFSGLIFLYAFLPLCLLTYALCKNMTARNIVLLIFSLLFYAWGEPKFVLLLLLMSAIDWFAALRIQKIEPRFKRARRRWVIFAAVTNLALIGWFKYAKFLFSVFGDPPAFVQNIALPIGISFYTFQLLSYVVDVERQDAEAEKEYWHVLLYASLFHQCIAGPIVRYKTIAAELFGSRSAYKDMGSGVLRFTVGLAKKVLLANVCGELVGTLLVAEENLGNAALAEANLQALSQAPVSAVWAGMLAYALQIYLDFSAYSDMAIGLGRMVGLHYQENFDHPYCSRSITEFWRRWHMSLGTFFRDYVYIPLGGSRKGGKRTIFNLFVVWALTGLWHGASWNFVLWGLYFFVFLVIEKHFLKGFLEKHRLISHLYALVVVYFGWILFRYSDMSLGGTVLKGLFGLNGNPLTSFTTTAIVKNHIFLLGFSILVSTPLFRIIGRWLGNLTAHDRFLAGAYQVVAYGILPVTLLLLSTAALVGSTYNPFMYFQF